MRIDLIENVLFHLGLFLNVSFQVQFLYRYMRGKKSPNAALTSDVVVSDPVCVTDVLMATTHAKKVNLEDLEL